VISREVAGHRILVMRGHLPARDHGLMDPAPAMYLIRINGHLGATVLSAFPGLIPRQHGAHTVLTGLLDQSALYGVLGEIEALGLDLLEVRQLSQGVLGAVRGQYLPRIPRRMHEPRDQHRRHGHGLPGMPALARPADLVL
jgi:hypothetical protein